MKEPKTLLMRGEDGEARRVRRVMCGDEGHLYYGDGTEPCHCCGAEVGQPHLLESSCDHEECPLCREQMLGCGCEVAAYVVSVAGAPYASSRSRTFQAEGFTEAEARSAADLKFEEAGLRAGGKWAAQRERLLDGMESRAERLTGAEADRLAARWAVAGEQLERAQGRLAEIRVRVLALREAVREERERSHRARLANEERMRSMPLDELRAELVGSSNGHG